MLMGLFYGRLLFVLLLHQVEYAVIGFHPTLIWSAKRAYILRQAETRERSSLETFARRV